MDTLFIVCPRCKKCAKVKETTAICRHYGYYNDHVDLYRSNYFLKVPCLGTTLWASGTKHLDYLEKFVSDLETTRVPLRDHYNQNRSMAARLPWFFRSDKKRKLVLSKLQVLRQMVASADP
eukprot:Phypoly_transcript_25430.p1 GENE.Phypoly_transcript_25430~~Phypoly_transcript_25430.p1  ORF type:complete len:121 (+),score=7.63 Phypoly_transcript_25430:123-485(+)